MPYVYCSSCLPSVRSFTFYTLHSHLRFRFPEFVLHSSSFSAKLTSHQPSKPPIHPSIEAKQSGSELDKPFLQRRVSETGRHGTYTILYSVKNSALLKSLLVPASGCSSAFRVPDSDAMWLVTLSTRDICNGQLKSIWMIKFTPICFGRICWMLEPG